MRSIHSSLERHFRFALLLLTCSSVALTGCNASFNVGGSLDTAKLESAIKDGVSSQTGFAIQSISCPKEIKGEANATFQCQAKTDKNDSFTISVTQKDDKGNVSWKTPVGLLSLTKIEQEIQEGIEKQLQVKVKANCGGAAKVVRAGEAFDCKVTDDQGKAYTAKVTAKDDNGNVSWKI